MESLHSKVHIRASDNVNSITPRLIDARFPGGVDILIAAPPPLSTVLCTQAEGHEGTLEHSSHYHR
eukprot:scaffold97855_cov18-Prasinocladus_malaysianus.AAC.1